MDATGTGTPLMELDHASQPVPASVLEHVQEHGVHRFVDARNMLLYVEETTDPFKKKAHVIKAGRYFGDTVSIHVGGGHTEDKEEKEEEKEEKKKKEED